VRSVRVTFVARREKSYRTVTHAIHVSAARWKPEISFRTSLEFSYARTKTSDKFVSHKVRQLRLVGSSVPLLD
jgi:hypothetical protein